jgi:hypothetical protein
METHFSVSPFVDEDYLRKKLALPPLKRGVSNEPFKCGTISPDITRRKIKEKVEKIEEEGEG